MDFHQTLQMAIAKAPLAALANDVRAVAHKLRYPMAEILAKVPGDTLAERARQIGVSRQTMYVWAQERFRPSGAQAAAIANLTGVPIEQITDYQEGKDGAGTDSVRKPARKARSRVAKDGKGVSARKIGAGAQRGGVALKRRVGGSLRAVRKRTQRGPRGGKDV